MLDFGKSSIIASGIALNTLVNETLDFIHRQLPNWRDDPERPEEESEETLNGNLCDFLNYRARHDYPMAAFRHEELQASRRKVDLSVKTDRPIIASTRTFTKYDPYLVVEGKRLPAPAKKREMEYVTGRADVTGGIQRFKLGLHGASVETAAIVGYVQDEDTDFWLVRINGWISSLDGTECSAGVSGPRPNKSGITGWSSGPGSPHPSRDIRAPPQRGPRFRFTTCG
jgi:hypothetical protein